MVDPAHLIRILAHQPDDDRAVLLDALAPMLARNIRRLDRDAAIRAVAQSLPDAGLSERARAEAVQRELRRYGAAGWRSDQRMRFAPADRSGTMREHLFLAFQAAGGRPPLGQSQLRAILRGGR